MSITVASVLNAKGKRSKVAESLDIGRLSLNQWVTLGFIPAKYIWALSGPTPFNIDNPEFRALFRLVEPRE
jgi:hypothetical protein